MTDLERAQDDLAAMICAVGVKHGLNIHPAIARDMADYIQEQFAGGFRPGSPDFDALAKARREGMELAMGQMGQLIVAAMAEMRKRAAADIIAVATEEASDLADAIEALHYAAARVAALPLTPEEPK